MDPENNEEVKTSAIPPPRGPETGEGADNPLEAIAYAEEKNLGPDGSIVNTFTPDEKVKLMKMIKHGECNAMEGAVLKALMTEALTLDELAVTLGARSEKTKGEPMSKVAALKELNRIFAVVAKRSKAKLGYTVDLSKIKQFKAEMRRQEAEKRKKKAEEKRRAREA